LQTAISYGALVTVILIAARTISSYAALLATLVFRPGVAPNRGNRRSMLRMPLVLGWTGMRGVVSLAAALAIPITLQNGAPFPHRNLILFITFTVILLTLLIQGLTLPYIIKRSFFTSHSNELPEENTKWEVREKLAKETVKLLKELHAKGLNSDPHLLRMIEQWEHKINQPEKFKLSDESKQNYLDLLEQQRIFLDELNKDPELDEDIIRLQIYQIDLEEERVKLL
jgi:NhaP-type Na+/H+ or K+/H+ antiporter